MGGEGFSLAIHRPREEHAVALAIDANKTTGAAAIPAGFLGNDA
jgi:hypothetical protein